MLTDRYGLELSTDSREAHEAYQQGVDLLLSANVGAADAFERAVAADPEFALGHAGLARAHQLHARPAEARRAEGRAVAYAATQTRRERQHVAIIRLLGSSGEQALAAARAHLAEFPRDAMVLAPCTGVFGLIGFSGRRGRERELVALLDSLADAYGNDWWFLAAHAFALSEAGELALARPLLARSLAMCPRSANGAHIQAHVLYEEGGDAEALEYLAGWLREYPRAGVLHCHLSWHVAIMQLEARRFTEAWETYRANIEPGAAWGPPLNTLTDAASFLWRSELEGGHREAEQWNLVAEYAESTFPRPGIAFADCHAAMALSSAHDAAALDRLHASLDANTATGPMLRTLIDAWRSFGEKDWSGAVELLEPLIAEHERIGGSRAQRDVIEYTLAAARRQSGASTDPALLLRARAQRFVDRTAARSTDGVAARPASGL